jgi:hypothetical protein
MIRIYIYRSEDDCTVHDKYVMVDAWVAALNPTMWKYGLITAIDKLPCCLYLKDDADVSAFLLKFGTHVCVKET